MDKQIFSPKNIEVRDIEVEDHTEELEQILIEKADETLQ